ncbi:MAG TPA: YetF domain-containing protein [Egibacteraceae bacterium]|nr:DUF421 domain-containing protein [Actinomycetota bacterium]HWB70906.1 YetF domain-containing protein [Egibacteraceae bacterium]
MIKQWLATSWTQAALVAVSSIAILVSVIVYTRLAGLRSFSKMSSFDFAITVAFGTIIGSVALSPSATVANGVIALGMLYGLQALIAAGRRRHALGRLVDNRPLLLMVGSEMLADNLRRARVTEGDVRGKLREANVLNYDQVRAVVLEQTGDISVLHGDGPLDLDLFDNVRGRERLEGAAGGRGSG